MTANEMRRLFFLLRDGDATVDREFNDFEVGRWLTKAQDELVTKLVFGRTSIEEGSERDTELYMIKTHMDADGTLFVPSTKYDYAFEYGLPADYLYNLSERVDITYNGKVYRGVGIKVIEEDNYNEHILSPFHKPDRRLLWRVTEQGTTKKLILIGDISTQIDKYYSSYVRRPQDIVVDIITPTNQQHCELDEEVHRDIVELAVRMSMAATGSPKYQLAINEERS